MRYYCPNCDSNLVVREPLAGGARIQCPACRAGFDPRDAGSPHHGRTRAAQAPPRRPRPRSDSSPALLATALVGGGIILGLLVALLMLLRLPGAPARPAPAMAAMASPPRQAMPDGEARPMESPAPRPNAGPMATNLAPPRPGVPVRPQLPGEIVPRRAAPTDEDVPDWPATTPPSQPARPQRPAQPAEPPDEPPVDLDTSDLLGAPPAGVAPRSRGLSLKPVKGYEFDIPRLARKGSRAAPPPKTAAAVGEGKLSIDEIKKAVVFIKVEAGDVGGSGSGFVIRAENGIGLVATNCHVIVAALIQQLRSPSAGSGITVVFDSGQPAERSAAGEILAFDFDNDLALLRVRGISKLPRPIDPAYSPKLSETMPVFICGFPFGQQLATSSRSPAMTIGKGSVSSVRLDDSGEVAFVQIDGSINPGNSGGPVVDPDGRLAGVAVATITGTGIGMAVPPGDLQRMLEGRVYTPRFIPAGLDGDSAVFLAVVPVIDPMKKVKSVSLLFHAGANEVSGGEVRPYRALEGAMRLTLKHDRQGMAAGILRVPARDRSVSLFQVAFTDEGGTAFSRAVPFRLDTRNAVAAARPPRGGQRPPPGGEGNPRGADALPPEGRGPSTMILVNREPQKYIGKTLVMRGRVSTTSIGRGDVNELQVNNENDTPPINLHFVTSRAVVTELTEIPRQEQTLSAQLTCRIGAIGPDRRAEVTVTKIEFLRGERVVRTIPEAAGRP